MVYKGLFAYIEFITRTKSRVKKDGKVYTTNFKDVRSGHYEITDEDKNYIMIKEEEIEIPVAKKDLIKFELKEKPIYENS